MHPNRFNRARLSGLSALLAIGALTGIAQGDDWTVSGSSTSVSPGTKVGIGIGTPSHALHVIGDAHISSTLGVTGLFTASGGLLPGLGSDGAGRIFQSSVNGLKLRGVTGTANDFYIASNVNSLIMRNPTGTTDVVFGNSVSTGSSFTSYGIGSLGDANYERISIIHTGSAAELRSQAGGTGTVEPLRLVVGSTPYLELTSSGNHTLTGTLNAGNTIFDFSDNMGGAFVAKQGSNDYLRVNTTNGAESVNLGNTTTNPTLNFLGTSTKAFNGPVTMSSTLGVTGLTMATGGVEFGLGTGADGRIFRSTVSGLFMRGVSGSSYDIAVGNAGGAHLIRNPTGTQGLEFPGSGTNTFTGPVAMSSTLGVTGLTMATGGVEFGLGTGADGRIFRSTVSGLFMRGVSGSSYDIVVGNAGGAHLIRNPTGTQGLEFPGSGTNTFTGPVAMSSTLGITGALTVSSTLGVTGLFTASGGLLPGLGSDGAGRIFQSSVNGLKLRGVTGTANDFYIASNGNSLIMRNPTGTTDVVFGNSVSTGSSFTSYGIGSLGDANYERISIIHTGGAAELRSQAGGTGTAEPLRLVVGSTPYLELTSSGNHTLTGTLIAGTVKATAWEIDEAPDYVFEKDYELASLEKVESFVRKNKHLPEVPSARQMKEEGLDLVKMNFQLLKKVEELTLYAIGQNKEIEALKRSLEKIEETHRNVR